MSAVVTTRPAALLKTTGGDLKKLFNAVLAHDNDSEADDHPMLSKVHIEVRDGSLRLICSDRFTLGVAVRHMDVMAEGFTSSFAVAADEIRAAREYLDETEPATFIVEGDTLRIRGNVDADIPGVGSELPWRDVLNKCLAPKPTPTGVMALDPELLARFREAKHLAPNKPMVFHLYGETSPTVVTIDGEFIGMIAPINMKATADVGLLPDRPLDAWFDLLDESPVEPPKAGA